MAGFIGALGIKKFDELNHSFTERQFAWDVIREHCERFVVINSDNDPYVSLEKGKELARNLATPLITLKNAGHINAKAGFDRFELLFEMVKKEL